MTNNADPDQLASSEANWSGSTLFASYTVSKGRTYLGSAGHGLKSGVACVFAISIFSEDSLSHDTLKTTLFNRI